VSAPIAGWISEASRSAAVLAVAAALGFLLLVALFKLGVAGSMDILFYRGVALCVVAFVLTTAIVAVAGRKLGRISLSEAIAAGALSLGLNLSFLVIAPVTVDRSISVFLLSHMAQNEQHVFTTHEMENAFRRIYLGDLGQIQRRTDEQQRSGNIVPKDGGYVLTPQGATFIRWARMIAWAFDTDPRLLQANPPTPRTAGSAPVVSPPR
jgi:hypothetical protein